MDQLFRIVDHRINLAIQGIVVYLGGFTEGQILKADQTTQYIEALITRVEALEERVSFYSEAAKDLAAAGQSTHQMIKIANESHSNIIKLETHNLKTQMVEIKDRLALLEWKTQ